MGKVTTKPDVAQANIGVEIIDSSVSEASAQNKIVIEEILAALKANGVAAEDIQTSGFSVWAERYGPEGPLSEDDTRYHVSNNVSVMIRDLDSVGEVLDAAVEAGANNIFGVQFSREDTLELESEARAKAVARATEKAAELAELAGVELGPVISISEIIGSNGGFYAGSVSEMAMNQMGGGGGAPIEPGQLEIAMQMELIFAIAE